MAKLIKLAGCDVGASCPAIYRKLAGCPMGDCPAVYRTDDKIIIVGSVSEDPDMLAKVGEGEQAVEISVQLWDEAMEKETPEDIETLKARIETLERQALHYTKSHMEDPLICGICGKLQGDVDKLICGEAACICSGCVATASGVSIQEACLNRDATIASLEQKLEEMKAEGAKVIEPFESWMPDVLNNPDVPDDWVIVMDEDAGVPHIVVGNLRRVKAFREKLMAVMPPSESADGFVSAKGPLHPGDGNARFCTCQVAQDFERCGAGLLIHEDDDGKVGGLCITGISGGARYVAGTFEDGGFPESLDLVRLDDELGVRMRYQAMPDEEEGPVEVIHPGDGETR